MDLEHNRWTEIDAERDTPRTDDAIMESNGSWSFELRDLCRQLERELNAANAEIERLRGHEPDSKSDNR